MGSNLGLNIADKFHDGQPFQARCVAKQGSRAHGSTLGKAQTASSLMFAARYVRNSLTLCFLNSC